MVQSHWTPLLMIWTWGLRVPSGDLWMTRANSVLGWPRWPMAPSRTGAIIPLYSTPARPRLKCCAQFWAPHFKKDSEVPEHTQQRAAMLAKGLKIMSCEEWPRGLGLFSLRMRRLRGTSLKRGGGWSLLPCLQWEDQRKWPYAMTGRCRLGKFFTV